MTLRVRVAVHTDLEAMWRIERDVFGADSWSENTLREELTGDHRRYLVLVDAAGAVHGYAGLLALGEVGDIQTVAVAPAWRGQGYGRVLMHALAEEAEKCGVRDVFLEVRADNESARQLYLSLGFAEIGLRPRYYQPDGVDAIVMQSRLEPSNETEQTDGKVNRGTA